jgi:hypothetical protein
MLLAEFRDICSRNVEAGNRGATHSVLTDELAFFGFTFHNIDHTFQFVLIAEFPDNFSRHVEAGPRGATHSKLVDELAFFAFTLVCRHVNHTFQFMLLAEFPDNFSRRVEAGPRGATHSTLVDELAFFRPTAHVAAICCCLEVVGTPKNKRAGARFPDIRATRGSLAVGLQLGPIDVGVATHLHP